MNKLKNEKTLTKDKIEIQISKCYEDSISYTQIMSTICRQISFAEGALFWFVRSEFNVSLSIISLGFFFLLLYFIFDFLQYMVGYFSYKNKALAWENDLKMGVLNEKNYEYSPYFHYWIEKILYLKLFFLLLASLILIACLIFGISRNFC